MQPQFTQMTNEVICFSKERECNTTYAYLGHLTPEESLQSAVFECYAFRSRAITYGLAIIALQGNIDEMKSGDLYQDVAWPFIAPLLQRLC